MNKVNAMTEPTGQCGPAIVVILLAVLGGCHQPTREPATLKEPYVRHEPGNRGVIIFVHGVFGDASSTWTAANGANWPSMLAKDDTFQGEDIYLYGFPSPKRKKSYSIDELAEDMRLKFSTQGVLDHDHLTFVAHSMGGLVTRAYLIKYRDTVAAKVRSLHFFGAPTEGSPKAQLAKALSRSGNTQLTGMFPLDSDNYLGALQSAWLATSSNPGSTDLTKLPSFCAYETQATFGLLIVERRSATGLCNRRIDPVDTDHLDIVKPVSMEDKPYLVLKSAFLEVKRGQQPLGQVGASPELPPEVQACRAKHLLAARSATPGISEVLYDLGYTLADAAKDGDLECVQALVESSLVDVNTKRVVPALLEATYHRQEAIVRYLLSHDADPNTHAGTSSQTALHYAASQGYMEIVRMLVENKPPANVNEEGPAGSALIASAARGDANMTVYLLAHGADACASFKGMTAKEMILQRRIRGAGQYLSKDCGGR
jgi:pimeloyl-ACP methyl ester carboxylesterase